MTRLIACWLVTGLLVSGTLTAGSLVAGSLTAMPASAQTVVTEPPSESGPPADLSPDPSLAPTPLPPPDPGAANGGVTPDPDDWDIPHPAPPVRAATPMPQENDTAAAEPPPQPAQPNEQPMEPLPPAPAPLVPEPPQPVSPATIQPPYPVDRGVTSSAEVIADCICAQRRTAALHGEAARAQQRYQDAQSRLAALNAQLQQTRSTVNSDDDAQVDAYRRLLVQSEQQNSYLFNTILPRTQSVIARYNQSVATYNARCTGRRFDTSVTQEISQTLTCP